MSKISLDVFHRYTASQLDAICEFNPAMDIEYGEAEGTKYITIRDVLLRPDDFREFISKFPCEDRNISIEQDNNTHISSKAPGFQQPIDKTYFPIMGQNLYTIGRNHNLFKYRQEDAKFEYYTNCCYPGMKAYNKNYLPHVDPFSIASNIYLTDVPNSGTSFFKFMSPSGKEYYSVSELVIDKEKGFATYKRGLEKYDLNSGWSEWKYYTGDHFYQRYHYIPGEYNSCSMYRGNRWHSITYDSVNSTDVRYSIVGVLV